MLERRHICGLQQEASLSLSLSLSLSPLSLSLSLSLSLLHPVISATTAPARTWFLLGFESHSQPHPHLCRSPSRAEPHLRRSAGHSHRTPVARRTPCLRMLVVGGTRTLDESFVSEVADSPEPPATRSCASNVLDASYASLAASFS
jgi:hypothetical protein